MRPPPSGSIMEAIDKGLPGYHPPHANLLCCFEAALACGLVVNYKLGDRFICSDLRSNERRRSLQHVGRVQTMIWLLGRFDPVEPGAHDVIVKGQDVWTNVTRPGRAGADTLRENTRSLRGVADRRVQTRRTYQFARLDCPPGISWRSERFTWCRR